MCAQLCTTTCGCLFLPIKALRLHTLVCGASPMSWSEYYCCCLRYPPFPSLPLTERGSSYSWATSTFVGFYCCGEEAIAIERALVALPETDRWEPGLQMVRGSLGGRETTVGSKTQGLPRWLSSLLSSPRPSACLPSLSAPLPARELSFLFDRSLVQACARLTALGSLLSHWRRAVFLSVFWWADEESAGPHHRDEGAHFFHRSALDCLLFPAQAIRATDSKRFHWNHVSFNFLFFLMTPSSDFVEGHLKEFFFVFLLLGSWGTGGLVGEFVCLKPTCVFLDRVVCCRKRGALAAKCWLGRLHQENIKRPFMRCCKEERVFWEHHQTARVIPLFKICPEDTG